VLEVIAEAVAQAPSPGSPALRAGDPPSPTRGEG
jgi:hypothetical protein